MVYISAKKLQDDGFASVHDTILLAFVHEPHRYPFLHPSDILSSDTEADSETVFIDLQHPPVQTQFHHTPHLDNHLAGKSSRNQYFDIFENEINICSPCSCEEDYGLVHW